MGLYVRLEAVVGGRPPVSRRGLGIGHRLAPRREGARPLVWLELARAVQ